MAGMELAIFAIVAVLGMAGYVAYLFVMRLPMSRTGYLVCCTISFLIAMTIMSWGLHYLIYEVSVWLGLPLMAVGLLTGWLIDRHEYRQGTLRLNPKSKFDQWYVKFLSKGLSEDHRRESSESHTRLDPPE